MPKQPAKLPELVATIEATPELLKQHKLSQEEYKSLVGILGRPPTMPELGVFSSMWSEHCSYKSSRVHLKRLPTTGPNVVLGPGENAGVVRIDEKLCAVFKMESHNHPSYIEPYQGAATGVGGILRDVFCMGARPVANLNALRFGRFDHPRTPYLVEHVVAGIGDYGNCIGVPTVAGSTSFHKSYDGNCLVNAMTVGLIHEDKIFKGYASGPGNLVVYVGSATGRDGIHGATMASDSFETADAGERSAVQVGDPFTEKLLLEATLEALEKDLVVGLQDMGAAGLTSSSFEMADRAGTGLFMDLDLVPLRAETMSAYEILLSESQERMLMVVEPDKWEELAKVLAHWELAYAVIGEVTDSGRVEIVKDGKLQVSVQVAPLTEAAPKYDRPRKAPKQRPDGSDVHIDVDRFPSLMKVVTKKHSWSQKSIYEQYDRHIGNKTILGSDHGGAAVLWPRSPFTSNQEVGIAMTTGCLERYLETDPQVGAELTVLKNYRALSACGALPLAATDCLNFGNPEDPLVMEGFSRAVDGIARACEQLATPIVSGNVSLYNETDGSSILPTPMIGMVGRIDKASHACPARTDKPAVLFAVRISSTIPRWQSGLVCEELGVSCEPREPDYGAEQALAKVIRKLATSGKLLACRDHEQSGLALAVLRIAGSSLSFTSSGCEGSPIDHWLGGWGGYLLATGEKDAPVVSDALKGFHLTEVGQLSHGGDSPRFDFSGFTLERTSTIPWESK